MNLFSIIQWHHFAYMIISLALLGYGISGSVIFLLQGTLIPVYRPVYIGAVLLFGISSLACFLIAQMIPFNAEEVLWDVRQPFYLLTVFLLLSIPFFFAASAICLTFMAFRKSIAGIYAMDLLGAGSGSLLIILLLYLFFPVKVLVLLAIAGLLAAVVGAWELKTGYRHWLTAAVIGTAVVLIMVMSIIQLEVSPYKSQSQQLQITGTGIITERSSPLGVLSVIESRDVPIRHAPGMSLQSRTEPLPQMAVFTNGEGMTVLTEHTTDISRLAYLDQVSWALPYHLSQAERVLVVGAGGGSDILQAIYHNAGQIDAVELNPQLVELVQKDFGDFTGRLFERDEVTIHIGEIRDFLSLKQDKYQLIQLVMVDGFNASSSGLYALNESYIYTVEAIQAYLNHLEPNGYLTVSRWVKLPPRDTLKLFATAVTALKENGINKPEQRLLLIRSWQTSTLVVKNGIFSANELEAARRFTNNRSFDLACAPDMHQGEANQYNKLTTPVFHDACRKLLSPDPQDFINQYKFNLQPATDDRPFFHHFFKWTSLPEIMGLKDKGGMPLIEWGYLVLIGTLLIAFLLGLILIVLPLKWMGRAHKDNRSIPYWRILVYFFTVGLAFMFNEIAMIQKFIQFLHHPIFAIAVVLTTFLVFAGIGSKTSEQLVKRLGYKQTIWISLLAIVLISGGYLAGLQWFFSEFASITAPLKILISVLLISPLAFFMGMPFPLALAVISPHDESLIARAWGINGWASVISAVLATITAVHFGFSVVIVIAMLLYLMLGILFPHQESSREQPTTTRHQL